MPTETPLLKTIFLLLLVAIFSGLKAQQDPQFTHNTFNHAFVNPGSYGLGDGITVTGIFREQWVGFKDSKNNKVSPETFLVTGDSPIRFLHGGIGIGVAQDKEAQITNKIIKLGYAYHLYLGNAKLGIGINGVLNSKSVNFDGLETVDEGDPVLEGSASDAVMISDLAIGVFLQKPHYYVASSSNQVLQHKKNIGAASEIFYSNSRHYYLTGGYDVVLPAYQGFVFTPSLFLKSEGNTIQVDANLMARYNNKVWGGLSYRISDAVSIMVGTSFKALEIGYAYDIPTSRIAATGSHEIMVRYKFKLEREKTRSGYRNTRFL